MTTRRLASLLVLAFVLSSCTKDGGGDAPAKRDGETTPPKTAPGGSNSGNGGGGNGGGGNGGGGNGGGDLEGGIVPLSIKLSLGLVDAGTPVQDTPTYPDVAPIFNQNCAACHKPGFVSPMLDSFPFTAVNGDALDVIISKVSARMNDAARPMPPQGLMAPELRAQVDAWIAAGYPAAPVTRPGLSLDGYQIRVRQRAAGAQQWSEWQALAAAPTVDVLLGQQIVGSVLDVEMEFVGTRGGVLATKSLTGLLVPPGGTLTGSFVAPAEEDIVVPPPPPPPVDLPPVAPIGESLAASSVTDRSLVLNWTKASDEETPAEQLEYRIVSANAGALTSLEDMAGKVVVRDFSTGPTTLVVSGLIPSTSYVFNIQVRDARGQTVAYATPVTVTTLATPSDDPEYDILTYGKECSTRLGELKPFSCLDGEIIPITVGGHVPAEGYPAFGPGGDREQTCDKPALLGLGGDGRCPPYARLGRLDSYAPSGAVREDVETVFICRRYKGRFGPQTHRGETMDASVFPAFEDVAIIQHNKTTGETCWFQMLAQGSPKDARRVPPPTEAVLPDDAPAHALSAVDFWLPPSSTAGINCLSCHDSDPWIHTPYVDQVRLPNGKTLVPENPFGPYKMIGRRYFNEWLSPSRRSHAVNTADGQNTCASCHRIGSQNTCRQFVRESAGLRRAQSLSEFADSEYALRYWMPPEGTENRPADLTAWHNNVGGYKDAVDRLLECCNDPSSPACSRTPINDVPPPFAAD